MSDAILIQHIYPDTPGVKLFDLTREHHQKYCDDWGIDYKCVIDDPSPELDKQLGNWAKVKLIYDALLTHDEIIWLDADCLIKDVKRDLRDAVEFGKIGACWQRIPQLPQGHWNTGAMYVSSTMDIRQFFENWLAAYPPPSDGWLEQGIFNRMGYESDLVVTLSDKWNATIDVSMVPDAVVLGFHGQGQPEYRYNIMKNAIERLFPKKVKLPRMAEV